MKKTFIILIIIGLLLFFAYRDNNNPKSVILDLGNAESLSAGKQRYVVNFLGIIPAGEAVFSNEGVIDLEGKRVEHLRADAHNLKFYHWIRKVSAVLDSYVDTTDHNPVLFTQRLHVSGRADKYKQVRYDQRAGMIEVDGQGLRVPYGTQDPLSAIFNLRRMDFGTTNDLELNINTNQKNYVLEARARNIVLKIQGKDYPLIMVEGMVRRRDKNPCHQSRVTMYLLRQGGQNIPLLIKVFASGILINAKLIDG